MISRFLRVAILALFAVYGLTALAAPPAATCPTISMSPVGLPNGDLASVYTPVITSSNGTAPVMFDITSGVLPNGVTLTDNTDGTATFGGTSTQTGTFEFTITATDANGCSGGRTYAPTFAAATSSTALALTAGTNPSVFGQSLTFTATVTSASGTPTGTVTFKDGAATLGTGALNGSGVATFTTSTLAVGIHAQITAVYGGDPNFAGSTSAPLSQTVSQASTTTTLSSGANPSVFGQSVTFTATVAAVSPGAGTPTGTVTFTDGVINIGSGALDGSGVATLTTSTLTVAAHQITATYNADTNFGGSTSSVLTQTVNQAATATAVASVTNPSVFGQSVTFTAAVTVVAPGTGTPTGTVTFLDGATNIGSGVLNASGIATLAISTLTVGSHPITASYGADTNFSGSTSSALSQTVNQAATTTTLGSSANPSAANQSVTFTATVTATAPGAGTLTGTVTFFDGVTNIGSGALAAGVATFTTSTLAVGSHSITATYAGDVNFTTSTSAPLNQTVNLNASTTTLTSSINPTVFGQSTTFTATVTSGAGTPTGTVAFMEGPTLLGTGPLVAGVATFPTSSLVVGAHSITAVYSGDSSFAASTSGPLTQTVNQAATTTVVGSSINPSVFGQSVTLTATVAAVAPGAGTPTGTVTFKDGAVALGLPVALDGSGQATFTSSTFAVANHTITAFYSSDTNFLASDNTASPLAQAVTQASTTTALNTSGSPSVFGQSVTFTATVAPVAPGAGTPTGTVTFTDSVSGSLGSTTLSGGVATLSTSVLSTATHSITASYSSDTNFTASTSGAVNQVVNKAATTTSLTSSLNPSVFGDSVTFTATVAVVAPGAGTPTGMVTFNDGATPLGSVALSGGVATLATSTLTVGGHSITATVAADANFTSSTSSTLTQTVNQVPTATSVSSNNNPSVFQQSVTFTATVTHAGGGTATGTVNFFDGATNIGSAALSAGGTATFTTSTLTAAASPHTITAVYSGDTNFATSTSAGITQTVNKANQTITLTLPVAPANGSTGAGPHTYAAAATASSGLPVAFTIDATSTANACSIASNTVTFGPNPGTCVIDANQAGDGNWNAAPQVQQTTNVLVPASAVNDSHAVTGNIAIAAAGDITANDTGTNIALKSYGATGNEISVFGTATGTTQGGSVALNANGTYSYDPPANFTGTDTFKYIIDNALNQPSTGTVTLNITDRIMVVATAGVGAADCKRATACVLSTADAAAAASGKDLVFVQSGGYTAPNATITLNANQNLVGNFVSLAQAISDAGITLAAESVVPAAIAANTTPTLTNAGNVITLGGNNLVEYFSTTNSAGSAILGNTAAAGTNTIHDITVTDGAVAGNGVNITANLGTLNFSNLIVTTSSGNAFVATGGGTVSVTTGSNFNSLSSTTGTALNVSNTTIAAIGLTFRSISAGTAASGPASGIVLNTTGASGGLVVSGTGSAGSGGTIQKTTGNAIDMTSTGATSLSWMTIQNSTHLGINGTTLAGFTLANSSVINNGTTANADHGIKLLDVSGSATFTSDTVTGNHVTNLFFGGTVSSTTTTTALSVTGGTYGNSATNSGIQVGMTHTSVLKTATFSGITFSGNASSGLQVQSNDNSIVGDGVGTPATGTVTVTGCTFTNNAGNTAIDIDQGGGNGAGQMYARLINNTTITGNGGPAINIFDSSSATGGTMKVRIDGNDVGNAAVAGSGTTLGPGIRVFLQGKTTNTVTIVNNTVRQTLGSRAIDVEAIGPVTTGQPLTASDIVISGNNVDTNDESNPSGSLDAIYVAADNQGSPAQLNAEIHGNTIPAFTGANGCYDYPTFDGNAPWLYYRIATAGAVAKLFNFGGHANANTEIAATQTAGTAGADITNFGGVQLTATPVNAIP